MKVTNSTKAKQGIRVNGKLVYVEPGETKDVSPTPEEKKRIAKHPAFSKDADVAAETEQEVEETEEEKAEEGKDVSEKDDLIAQLAELGVTADKRSNVATLTAKLEEAKAAQ